MKLHWWVCGTCKTKVARVKSGDLHAKFREHKKICPDAAMGIQNLTPKKVAHGKRR